MIEIGIGLGSNIGDKAAQIFKAVNLLNAGGHVRNLRLSSLYRTAPWGNIDQDWFVNACAIAQTDLSPERLLHEIQRVELEMGRERIVHWGPRNIDIDILYYGDARVETPDLTLPHVELLNRAFVLVPLLELKPDLLVGGQPLKDALQKLSAVDVVLLSQPANANAR